ncbi:MAG: formate--tetrahydrofolate ligase [Candidatus Orphnella occulta]|nr:formate--tetrahydrofolate ligase [Candidatus Orphnella occulta]MDP8296726.1 formate--tetrahydrofolate ligase [Candidatus Orphnella occulta]
MPSDIEIAQRVKPKQITEIAKSAGIKNDELMPYGNHIAKVSPSLLSRLKSKPNGKLILVTSITPTKYGEGKTSTAIGLAQGFGRLKKKALLCLREPSLGPMFGIKGGACGGGYSQVIPMEDINLHFTGDGYAVSGANNLLCAMLDSSIYFGNKHNIDTNNIQLRRTIDISDRTLRQIDFNIDKKISYKSGFDIIAASETMAILALSTGIADLQNRLSRMTIAFTKKNKPVTPKTLNAVGSMSALLANSIMPNLVQTIEGNPAFVHCGPFANIAHGANSIMSMLMGLKLADYVITESGFGSDLGAEKFFDIVCRQGKLKPELAVIVVSQRAIKLHGMANLVKHINIIRCFGIEPVVAINKFPTDTDKSLKRIKACCQALGVDSYISDAVARGGYGATDLVEGCIRMLKKNESRFKPLYEQELSAKKKIEIIATRVYGAKGVNYSLQAKKDLRVIEDLGLNRLAVNIAKTQFSISDNRLLKGAPEGWKLNIHKIRIFSGAGFIVPVCGNILLLPGLPKKPAACNITADRHGKIKGLF